MTGSNHVNDGHRKMTAMNRVNDGHRVDNDGHSTDGHNKSLAQTVSMMATW